MPLITLTTDFGTADWFVGTMKGVILGFCPRASIVDITHEIGPGEIVAGAFALAAAYRFFPKGTVHVAVVDPGVGSSRPALAIETMRYYFVGPDNGLLSFALRGEKIKSVRRLDNRKLFLHPVSKTFHGRDVFAPVAAHLAGGLPIQKVGPAQRDFIRLPWPAPGVKGKVFRGRIIYTDRFGNLFTNIGGELLPKDDLGRVRLAVGRAPNIPLASHYGAVAPGRPVALVGSSGLLEIAVNRGSAAEKLRVRTGARVTLHLSAS